MHDLNLTDTYDRDVQFGNRIERYDKDMNVVMINELIFVKIKLN